jgi:hypothetical protein
MTNVLMVVTPYWHEGFWVFDDESAGLCKEPFVCGIPEMIDDLVNDIPCAESGFKLIFSSMPFPGYQRELSWVREEYGGNWYKLEGQHMEGWLCPAMFRYFESTPRKIYIKAEQAPYHGLGEYSFDAAKA